MITRLEVTGFKNLSSVDIEFGPFTCIAGRNGAGKSNIFDVVWFLSSLATGTPIVEAAQRVRGATERRLSDARDLFSGGEPTGDSEISIAAEMIVDEEVVDDLGDISKASATFLRYELRLGYEVPSRPGAVGRVKVLGEELRHITKGDAGKHLRFDHSASRFRNGVVRANRFGQAFLSTASESRGTVINVHGDGGSRDRRSPKFGWILTSDGTCSRST